jgi:hypothetical protein
VKHFTATSGSASATDRGNVHFTLSLATLWVPGLAVASALLGIPDVVLQAAAEWVRAGCTHLVLATLTLVQ